VGRGGRPTDGAAAAAASILDKLQDRKGVVKGRLRVSELGDVTVMRFNDVYMVEEAEISFIKKELLGNLTRPQMRILLDFQNVARFSSAAAEMLLDFHRRVQAKSGTLALCRVKPELHLILETLQIFPKIPHYNTPEQAANDDW
jgi:anti-anti-sigma regulatory factor